MPYSMEMRTALHDVAAHDPDEIVLQGLMADSSAVVPYPTDAPERMDWELGHNIILTKPAGREKSIIATTHAA